MKASKEELLCFHCGDSCSGAPIMHQDHAFCCEGCKTVFSILQENDMCRYYEMDEKSGLKMDKPLAPEKYAFLDNPELSEPLLQFKQNNIARVLLFIPEMHCASCIWLLERLHKLLPGILESRVNFDRKEVSIQFDANEISLRAIVEKMSAIGYEPALNSKREENTGHRGLLYRLGVAGFCSGNIMLFSFPEYLGMDPLSKQELAPIFQWLNVSLSLPVVLFSAQPFFVQAYKGLKHKNLNIDFPLALGILALFIRSVVEVTMGWGAGFFDTLSALVFFLLIGRWLQDRAYESLSFDRDFRSYFPIAVEVLDEKDPNESRYIPLSELGVGQIIRVRNGELIPADSLLMQGEARIDYSFVNGESTPEMAEIHEMIHSGGRQTGGTILLRVARPVSQSYLSSLWNQGDDTKKSTRISNFSDQVGRYFTWVLIVIALATLMYWLPKDAQRAFSAFTAVLIVACPCVLVVSAPFAFGNAMRWLAKKGIYLKNPDTVEKVGKVNEVVFDKTGTLTSGSAEIKPLVEELTPEQKKTVASMFYQSTHPISQLMFQHLQQKAKQMSAQYKEWPGKGIECYVGQDHWQLGSAKWILGEEISTPGKSEVCVACNGKLLARYAIHWKFREDLNVLFEDWKMLRSLYSGDKPTGKETLSRWFKEEELHFECSPADKLQALKAKRESGNYPMMVGDGLNDAGALKEAWLGVAITENAHAFTPACDVIMVGKSIHTLPRMIRFCKNTLKTVKFSFIFSLLYNSFWMTIAVQGILQPWVAALLMPFSSITVFAINTIGIRYFARKEKVL